MKPIATIPVLLLALAAPQTRDAGAAWSDGASRHDPANVIVSLASGAGFEGRLLKRGRTENRYETALGVRIVPRLAIAAERPAGEVRRQYESRLQALARDDFDAHEQLLAWCREQGLTSGAADEVEHLIRHAPERDSAWTFLADEAPHYLVTRRNHHPADSGRWTRGQIDLLWSASARADLVVGGIIREQLRALPVELQLDHAVRYSKKGNEVQRWIAALQLGTSDDVRRVRPLYRLALGDQTYPVRWSAVESLKLHDRGDTLGPFVKALLSAREDTVRAFAAEALGHLGDRRAVAPLVHAMRAAGDIGHARVNIASTNQLAYLKDYDVEVAQTAFIADPLVDIVQDGLVLDVTVISINAQRTVVGRALRRLTGVDLGGDPGAWSAWWAENRSQYQAAPR